MESVDLERARSGLSELKITPEMTKEDAARSMQLLAPFNLCTLGVVRFSGETPWERQLAPKTTTLLFATPTDTTETSWAEDPRRP